jgi:hypothetical protein
LARDEKDNMKKSTYLVIALISLTLIPLELTWTRILSAEFFYTFAFLVLSLAVLGLGLGGLALRLFQRLNRPGNIWLYLVLAALWTMFGPALVFLLAPDFSLLFTSWATVGKLVLTILILMSPFFFGGMALSLLFKQFYQDMPRLYMADLLGAGLGVLAAIWAMNLFGTPQAAFLIALPILAASVISAPRAAKAVPVILAVGAILLAPYGPAWLSLPRKELGPVIYTHWDALSKLKLYEFAPDSRGFNIDNVANSPVYMFDGKWEDIKGDTIPWGINVYYLVHQFDSCVFLSLGAGGGADVLQALGEEAVEVHAVEINGQINRMMLADDTSGYTRAVRAPDSAAVGADTSRTASIDSAAVKPLVSVAEFSGYIYRDPRVKVVTEDARAYVRRFRNKFDVIYSLSSNTWAALASGSFALAENYLFTTEAFIDYWRALSDSGYMVMEHQMYMPRLVSEVKDALARLGVQNPTDHFAVYDLPQMRRKVLLLSKRPLTDDIRYHALGPLTQEKFTQIHLIYPPADDSVANHLIARIINNGWQAVADSAVIDISPATDNRPFVAQLGLWKNFTAEKRGKVNQYAEFTGFPISKVMIMIVLIVVVIIALPINLVPYLKTGPHLRAAPWLYFLCLGMAFMAVEVVLIQKYALLIGSSLYSVATVLLTLLTASGLGSRFAGSFKDRTPFLVILAWLVLDILLFGHIVPIAGALSLPLRIIVSAVLIFPLGFFMGMPFPKAALRVKELIDWGFAVNGAASVLGSVLVLMVAFAWGFSSALILAAVVYLAAYGLFSLRSAWTKEATE